MMLLLVCEDGASKTVCKVDGTTTQMLVCRDCALKMSMSVCKDDTANSLLASGMMTLSAWLNLESDKMCCSGTMLSSVVA